MGTKMEATDGRGHHLGPFYNAFTTQWLSEKLYLVYQCNRLDWIAHKERRQEDFKKSFVLLWFFSHVRGKNLFGDWSKKSSYFQIHPFILVYEMPTWTYLKMRCSKPSQA